MPGRGDALSRRDEVKRASRSTRDFLTTLYGSVARSAARGRPLKDAFDRCREPMRSEVLVASPSTSIACHSTSRAPTTRRSGVDHPRIWTAERDREMWAALQG